MSAPLTFAQESIVFLEDLAHRPVYHMPLAFRIRGTLEVPALERALQSVVDRHQALRSAILPTPDGPRQEPRPSAFALRQTSVAENDLQAQLSASIEQPFDLASGQPFRADLFRLDARDHVLLLNLHHALGDMSSLGVIVRELGLGYGGQKLPAPGAQSGDYARRHRSALPSEASRAFWRDTLRDCTADLDLALDRARPKSPSFDGSVLWQPLPESLSRALKETARHKRCSLFMLAFAALQALVRRETGQQNFCIGAPISDRVDPDFEKTVGCLVNLLPVPCRVRLDQPFAELIDSVREASLQAFEHHSISLRQILRDLDIPADSLKPALARVVFQYFPETPQLDLPGLRVEPVPVHSRTSKFDLCFSLFESAGAIVLELEYDSDLFDRSSAERWSAHFVNVLHSVADNPAQTVGALRVASPAEEQLIARWNDTAAEYPRDATVPQLFEEVAAARPDAPALLFENQEISYRDLNERANAIAQSLIQQGVRPGDRVGICLPRSPQLVASIIGILKAGAAYVPFDTSYPRARLDYLFQDTQVRLLISDTSNRRNRLEVVHSQFLTQHDAPLEGRAPRDLSPDSPAYIMHTSGSTGEPKGVIVPHRAIVRLVRGNDFASFSPNEVWLAFAPISFDASTLELWAPLLNGGTLALYPPEFQSLEQFEAVLQKHRVTSIWLTAGLFHTIVDQRVEALRGVRQLLAGGDVLSVAHVRKALAALPQTKIINGYGPTENTTFTCCFEIPRDWPSDRPIPIGRPIRNTQAFILDESMNPVPVGVPGDLWAGGDGLSLGYLNKPDLTAASFVTWRGQRLYRTGDRARWRGDGAIEFLGRRDAQVKIRGFRIELGEIESVLRHQPGVRDAAAAVHSDAGGSKQLAAYVVTDPGAPLDLENLRAELSRVLPSHACPSAILPIAELPLGPNGKVNRAALPKPASIATSEQDHLGAPTPIESKLAEIWRQILEVPSIRLDDNFFHLGGESLRATRAISQINLAFNCRLTLPRMFEAPTIRQMASLVERSAAPPSEESMRDTSAPRSGSLPIDVQGLSDEEVDSLLNQLIGHDSAQTP